MHEKFQRFYCYRQKYQNVEKWLNFQKFRLKWKIVKHFTSSNSEPPLRELFSLSKPDKMLLRLWNTIRDNQKYTDICFQRVPRICSSWAWRIDAVQIFFLTSNRKMLAGKFVKWERFLAVLREHIIFNIKWVEVRKMSEVFWAKLYCKMSYFFC